MGSLPENDKPFGLGNFLDIFFIFIQTCLQTSRALLLYYEFIYFLYDNQKFYVYFSYDVPSQNLDIKIADSRYLLYMNIGKIFDLKILCF